MKKGIWKPLVWLVIGLAIMIVVALIIALAGKRSNELFDIIAHIFGG